MGAATKLKQPTLSVNSINGAFMEAVREFQSHGGSFGVAYAILCAAYGRGKDPHQDAAEGQAAKADKAWKVSPDAATGRGDGRTMDAEEAIACLPTASPRFKPGHARRGIAAIAAVQETVAKSLFDSIKLPDGRRLREVSWGEVPRLAQNYTFLARVMTLIHRKGIPVDATEKLDRIVSEDELSEIVSTVEKINDLL